MSLTVEKLSTGLFKHNLGDNTFMTECLCYKQRAWSLKDVSISQTKVGSSISGALSILGTKVWDILAFAASSFTFHFLKCASLESSNFMQVQY